MKSMKINFIALMGGLVLDHAYEKRGLDSRRIPSFIKVPRRGLRDVQRVLYKKVQSRDLRSGTVSARRRLYH